MTQWIITSSILIAVIAAARFLLRVKISLRLQYALWGLVLLRLLVPVSIGSTGISVMNVVEGTAVDATSRTSAVVGYIGGETPDLSVVEPDPNASPEEQAAQYETNRQAWQTEMDAARAKTGTPITVSGILKLIWLSGAAVMASWLLASNLRFSARLRRSRRALDVNDCSLPVYVSALIDTPCLFGFFRPSVYVTPTVAGAETVLRHSIEHETTHFRHGDHIWVVLRGVCLALHWYNPLVWLAAALSRRDAELACDEATIKRMGENERMEYGRTLIGLTCQKRTALLLTATTMTGSKRGIKERITLIAKKPKMAIYTLIAVVLIAALAVGCTFTGAKRSLTGEPVFTRLDEVSSITLGALPNDMRMVDEEHFDEMLEWISAFTLGEKQMGDAAPGSNSYSITLAYSGDESESSGLDIVVRDGTAYYVERPDFPDGWYEIWGAADDSSVVVDAEIDAPSAVIDYAADYVQQIVDSWNEGILTDAENGLSVQHTSKLTEARIVGLTQISTGTAGLNDGLALYLLEYRLLPEDPDIIGLAGGMQMEVIDGEQWLTEWGSTGQPHLLLYWENSGDETVWQRVCVTNTLTMQEEHSTPEMLEQYGDMYTAAAMELYKKHENGGTLSPTAAIDGLFSSGDIELTLYLDNDGAYNTYSAGEWYSGRFKVLLGGYEWTELEMPLTEPSDFWLTAASANGATSMTFWSNSGAGMVQYREGDTTTFWSALPAYDYTVSIAEDIRAEYDNLDVDYARISFYLDGSAEEAAETFVHSAYGSHMMSLAPGNMYGMSDYDVVKWEVREVSADGDAVVGWFECAFTPWDFDSPGIWAGNTAEGTEEYEGKLTFYREFVLQRQEDGYWHCIGFGTGGYSLPE